MKKEQLKSTKAVYTDLDSLFDTRAVLLAALSKQGELDIRVFGENDITNYFNRYRDNFGVISAWMFHYYYKYRTSNLLTHADLTKVYMYIRDYILDALKLAKGEFSPVIYINTYPYTLSTEETTMMLGILTPLFGENTDIIFINIRSREIEHTWIKEKNIGMVISYSAMEWLNYQIEINNGLLPNLINVKVFAPFILEGVIKQKDLSPDLIDKLTMFFRTTCDFEFLPVEDFCLIPNAPQKT